MYLFNVYSAILALKKVALAVILTVKIIFLTNLNFQTFRTHMGIKQTVKHHQI